MLINGSHFKTEVVGFSEINISVYSGKQSYKPYVELE